MIRTISFLALLLLAACAPTGNTPDAVCEREAMDDPTVKYLVTLQATNLWLTFNDPEALPAAKERAKRACLARLGSIPSGGGVEPVRRPGAAYQGIF